MRWGILFGAVVVVAACGGKSNSDDDDSAGQSSDAGKGGDAATGQGGSTAARGGSSARGGTSGGTTGGAIGNPAGGTAGDLSGGATGGTLSSGGMPAIGGTLSTGGTTGGTLGTGATGGTLGTGATGGSVDAMCTDLPATVPAAQFVYGGASTPPSPQGGTIQSGMYYLALETYYGADTQCPEAVAAYEALGVGIMEVVRFTAQSNSAGSIEVSAQVSEPGATPTRVTSAGTYSTSGSELSVVASCGDGIDSSAPNGFSVVGDQLVVFSTGDQQCTPITATFQKL